MECVILELHFANTDSLPIKFRGHTSQKNLSGKCFQDHIMFAYSSNLSKLEVREVSTKSSN